MIEISELRPYKDRYAGMSFKPLEITAVLLPGSPVVLYDPIYLDNLLARAVLEDAMSGLVTLEPTPEPYDIPIPVECAWRDDDGLPLWAASVFLPIGEAISDVSYTHKRLGRFEFSEKQPKTSMGRYMDRRTPIPSKVCRVWRAFCIGDIDEIARLLRPIRFLGKRRNIGFGEVESWSVSDQWAGQAIDTIVQDGALVHAIPEDAARHLELSINGAPSLVGWTPPQWKPSLFRPGWRVGTAARILDETADRHCQA